MPAAMFFHAESLACDTLPVSRLSERLKYLERSALPVHIPQNDRNNSCHLAVMSLQRSFHLKIVAIVRGYESGVDHQQDDVCCLQIFIDLAFLLLAAEIFRSCQVEINPCRCNNFKMRLQFLA